MRITDFNEDFKHELVAFLQSTGILRIDSELTVKAAVVGMYHSEMYTTNPLFQKGTEQNEIENTYREFFKFLKTADHNEYTGNIYGHVRAFKEFMQRRNKHKVVEFEAKDVPFSDFSKVRELKLSTESLLRTLKNWHEAMQIEAPVAPKGFVTLGGNLDEWARNSAFMKSIYHTLDKRGVKYEKL